MNVILLFTGTMTLREYSSEMTVGLHLNKITLLPKEMSWTGKNDAFKK